MRLSRVGWCIVVAAAYVLLMIAVPLLRIESLSEDLGIIISIPLFMLVQLALVVMIARLQMRPWAAVGLLVPSLIVAVGLSFVIFGLRITSPLLQVAIVSVRMLSMVLLAAAFGYLVSFVVREPNILLPAAVFAALVDYWNVNAGPLGHLVNNNVGVVETVTVQMPTIGQMEPAVMIGIGDFVFLGLFFGVLYRFHMNTKGAFWLGYVLLTSSMYLVMCCRAALPALVPMGVAVIGMNFRYFRLKREELLAILYAGVILLSGLLVAAYLYMYR